MRKLININQILVQNYVAHENWLSQNETQITVIHGIQKRFKVAQS